MKSCKKTWCICQVRTDSCFRLFQEIQPCVQALPIQKMPPGASWKSWDNSGFSGYHLKWGHTLGSHRCSSTLWVSWKLNMTGWPTKVTNKPNPLYIMNKPHRPLSSNSSRATFWSHKRNLLARNCNRVFRLWKTKLKNGETRNRWLGWESCWNLCIKDKEMTAQDSPKSRTCLLEFEKASRSESIKNHSFLHQGNKHLSKTYLLLALFITKATGINNSYDPWVWGVWL